MPLYENSQKDTYTLISPAIHLECVYEKCYASVCQRIVVDRYRATHLPTWVSTTSSNLSGSLNLMICFI